MFIIMCLPSIIYFSGQAFNQSCIPELPVYLLNLLRLLLFPPPDREGDVKISPGSIHRTHKCEMTSRTSMGLDLSEDVSASRTSRHLIVHIGMAVK